MKKFFAVGLLLTLAFSARAQSVFLDNFEEFPTGTNLFGVTYTPPTGLGVQIITNENGTANVTATISSLSGSKRLVLTPQAGAGIKYKAQPTQGLSNTIVSISWLMNMTQGSLNSTGGVAVDISTYQPGGIDHNPLLFFNDAGQIFIFTSPPQSPPFALLQIGSWASLSGKIMTNQLVMDYLAGAFSLTINGTVITNMTTPSFVTNLLEELQIEDVEFLQGSHGNSIWLDDITVSAPSTNQDVEDFIIAKGQMFQQISASTVSAATTGFAFHAEIRGLESNSISSASVSVPSNGSKTLQRQDPSGRSLEFNDERTTLNALNTAYPSGSYTLDAFTLDSGEVLAPITVTGDAYPNAPQVLNYDAAQAIGTSTNFTLSWNSFTSGTSHDFVSVDIEDDSGNGFSSPNVGTTNALAGTATSVVIPSGMLQPSTSYQGSLLFFKVTSSNTVSFAGGLGFGGYFKRTTFSLQTAAAPGLLCTLAPALSTNLVNTTGTLTATVTLSGSAVLGHTVNFSIISGPNTGTTGSSVSDGSGQATFGYSSTNTGSDVIQAVSSSGNLAATGTASVVWLLPNVPPVAVCQNLTVPADAGCQASVTAAQVDNGSLDPDGSIVSMALTPPGPYNLGVTNVTFSVTDNRGGTNSCSATITVEDDTAPIITCHANIVTNVPHGTVNAVVTYSGPTASDNCGLASVATYSPVSGTTFATGTTNTVTGTAIDAAGNTNTCTFTVIVNELPPETHDLAITTLKAPKKISLSATVTNVVGKFSVSIQNRGTLTETIQNFGQLTNLVTVSVTSLSNTCPSFVATMLPPKNLFPITLASKAKLTLSFVANFNCANDPLATSKLGAHGDYSVSAALHYEALNPQLFDTYPADDVAPRGPLSNVPLGTSTIFDKGVGGKDPITRILGAPIYVDVVVK